MKGLHSSGKAPVLHQGRAANRCPSFKQPTPLQAGANLHLFVAGSQPGIAPTVPHRSSSLATRQRVCLAAAAQELEATERTASSVDSVPRGETAGAILVVDNVTIQAGDRDLLQDVSWRVLPGQRWGLVGANGAGKSTLLHALCGHRMVDAGKVVISPKAEVGYLAQALQHATRTVYEEVRSAMTHLSKIEARMDEAEQAMMEGDVEAAAHMAQAQEEFALAGGWDVDKTISEVLSGLGFSAEQYDRNCSEFSGGWQMRIALAKLLLGPAGQAAVGAGTGGLMLLDEPTNHLDSAAVKWLGSFLRKSGGTVIIVSHDESLLDSACNHIVEVRGRKLHQYVGSFSKFMEVRAMREAQARATGLAQQQEIERLEDFVKRFGAKASKASAAQSKAKLAEKLRAEMVEIPAAASSEGGGDAKKVTLKLPQAPPCFTDVIMLKDASLGWRKPEDSQASSNGSSSSSQSEAKPLLSNLDLTIKKKQRVLVLGPNGSGKSTLLKALSGSLPLWSGTRKEGDGVRIATFSQDLAQDLPSHQPALSYVEDVARAHDPTVTMERCRQALGSLGLTGSMALAQIGVLSGGEKARVALAAFSLVPCNVLLLDEASNHLDAATISVLTGALREFQGAIVAITHNRAFAESLNATHILRVENGRAKLGTNMGLSDADFEHSTASAAPAAAPMASAASPASTPSSSGSSSRKGSKSRSPTPGTEPAKGSDSSSSSGKSKSKSPTPTASSSSSSSSRVATKPKPRQLSWKEQQEYQKLDARVKVMTQKRDELQDKVTSLASSGKDFKAMEAASLELGKLAEELDELEMRWLELAEIAGDI